MTCKPIIMYFKMMKTDRKRKGTIRNKRQLNRTIAYKISCIGTVFPYR